MERNRPEGARDEPGTGAVRPEEAALAETAEPEGQFPAAARPPAASDSDDHQGATEEQVGDLTGPGAGFDATAVDESDDTAGQSPGAGGEPAKREDPPGPRNQHERKDPPPRKPPVRDPKPRK
jgi:hypothetical protein